MKEILILGAGKSATALIHYLVKKAEKLDVHLTIVDQDVESARKKSGDSNRVSIRSFNIANREMRSAFISHSDLVISLLPAALHFSVTTDCISFKKPLLTASYLSPEVEKLKDEIEKAGILVMGEMGLDPGIDHMSAMKAIQNIREKGGAISSFESFCGALTAPESDDNPWHYKISWNPQSLITAGKEGAEYRAEGKVKTIPYESLFGSYKTVEIPELAKLAYYPNRNSERYARLYRLNEVPSILRATLRYPEFCEGWQMIVSLGLTDTRTKFNTDNLSYKEWLTTAIKQSGTTGEAVQKLLEEGHLLHKEFAFLGLFDDHRINKGTQTAGNLLLDLLSEKLALEQDDKDMIVMLHRIAFKESGKAQTLKSLLKVKGENKTHTAIAKTVGLPLGILAGFLITGKIKLTGLHIPILPEVYLPVLEALEQEGIRFTEYVH